jgi:hypothetical protein
MSLDDPTEPGSGSSYVREEQHGPEMDDTQVQATGELADQLDPVAPVGDQGSGEDSSEDRAADR